MGKVLFIRGGAVGDFIVTMPAIQLVRNTLPDVEIEILGYEGIAELAVAAGLADRVQSIEGASLAPFFAPGAKLDDEICDYFRSFDVVISYLYDPDQFFSDNLIRVGVQTLLKGPYKMQPNAGAAALQLAAPLEQLAMFLEQSWIEVDYPPVSLEPKRKGTLEVAIHPGSGSPAKNWSFEGWSELLGQVQSKYSESRFSVISGEAECERIAEFFILLDREGVSYRHLDQVELPQLGAILGASDLFLGHDSGISHLAATTGIPGVSIFGPTDPEVWSPQHPSFCSVLAPEGQLGSLTAGLIWNHTGFQNALRVASS